jgi:glycosyltransferase involved in cell wall biosynthesis
MNILFLTSWYPVTNTPHKGIFVQEHAHAAALAGHNVCVVALDVSGGEGAYRRSYRKFTDAAGTETHVVSIHSHYHKKIHALYPLLRRVLKKYLRAEVMEQFRPDIIHSNVLYPAAMIGASLSREYHLPHMITEHWSKANRFLEKNIFAAAGKKAYAEADAVTCVSGFLRNRLQEYLKSTKRVAIVPNVVRAEHFAYAAKPPQSPCVFAAVATWLPPKRPDLLVDALNRIAAQTGREIHLHLFGAGAQLDTLQQRSYSANLHIFYRGFCGKQEIGEQLRNTHFLLHASEIETFSIVVAEALCSGTPVVASDCGALPELIDETCGLLCDNTVDAWEKAILSALEKEYDHRAISERFRTRYSPETVGNSFSAIYREIIAPASR